MWRKRHRWIQVVSGRPDRGWFCFIICVVFLLTVTVLVPIHECVHHHNVLGLIGTCNCPCHSLTEGWHEGTGTPLFIGLAASALFSHTDLGILPFQSLTYHPAFQRAPPLLTA